MDKRLAMGELEARVMDVLWDAARPMKPGDVHQVLSQDRELAYTTVMTILVRLWQKGLLRRDRLGRAFAYQPVRSREEHASLRMRELLDAAADPAATLVSFVGTMSPAERARLRRLLSRDQR